ncbi:39S ribosomal protein L38, mitochondrial [Teleopsis dalmanni]|uniref:39S ribosomal protein L38, mitochondrial n=1 Tax=Teleopsis dalmanni TaxID=139649 RepID=UPI0018CF306C|nr:39S ribosomal protein L38, mitochondrial [Teleopsis dalmanni]
MYCTNLLIKNGIEKCVRSANILLITTTRNGHTIRGKPPGVAKTLEQRLQEENVKDPEIIARINIGFPQLKAARSAQLKERLAVMKAHRKNSDLEKQARSRQLLIDLKQVEEDYNRANGQFDLRVIADHYGIFEHLYGYAYFIPRIPLKIQYDNSNGNFSQVYNGNIIKPAEAAQVPIVEFDANIDPLTGKKPQGDTYWTLLATNLDGNLKANESECLHWFVANIPNGDVKKGEVLVDYLAPFPPKGLGYQRFVYVLYKQNSKLNFSSYKLDKADYSNLDKRTFKTFDFYRKYQDDITPIGLSFFQTDWDESLTNFYHNVLNIKEPVYEYDFPDPYLADQKWFPLKQAFNLYLDRHRDIREVNKQYLERKLAKTHPFNGPEPKLRFPNAHSIKGKPSWLVTEIKKQRLGMGRINDF